MAPTSHRQGPLQELPLVCFIPPSTNMQHASPLRTVSKRSRTPSALLSPTKRRILREEGYFSSISSELKKCPARGGVISQSPSANISSSRRLEFGLPSKPGSASSTGLNSNADPFSGPHAQIPQVVAPSRRLTPLPDFPASHKSFSRRSAAVSVKRDRPGTPSRSAAPIMVFRELPPQPDRHCAHYPGFDIYYDTHFELPSVSSRAPADSNTDTDIEGSKENLPPRKKAKKAASVPAEVGSPLIYKEGDEKFTALSVPLTPYHGSSLRTPSTPHAHRTPRMSVKAPYVLSSGRTTRSGKSTLARKRAMELEVDNAFSDEDEMT